MDFEIFEDVEEAFEFIKEREAAANRSIHPVQRNITYGSYWLRPVELDATRIVQVYGYVVSLEDLEREEDRETLLLLRESYERGYRFCRCFSEIVPDGEYGDVHISVMIPITEVMFEEAKKRGWELPPSLLHAAFEYSNMFIMGEEDIEGYL